MEDLFREEVKFPLKPIGESPLKGRKLKTGYAAPPGTGLQGETCRSCNLKTRQFSGSKSWYKCSLVKISGHKATDIKLRSPACSFWEELGL